ncbi:TonB-dependent receptor [Sulfitobacter sp. BDSS02]|nr:TonB-dependent receptor [Sulfitobacter sp. BDSS02]MBR9850634.1 TonB-dependent receptor [Paracoccaceae bacterium]
MATLKGRYDKVSSSFDNRIGANLDREDDAFSWRLVLMRQIGDFTPYVTVGTYFNPQALDASTLTSQAETGQQIEMGLKWQPNNATLIAVSAFDIRRQDVAQSFVNGGTSDSRTLGEVRSRGFELEADMRLTDSLALRAAFTDLDVEITELASDRGFVGKTPQSVVERFACWNSPIY